MKNTKKKLSKKSILFATILLLAIIVLWFVGFQNPPVPEPPNTQVLSQGTQMQYGDIDIGLGSVSDNSASLVIHKVGQADSVRKQVGAGDEVVVYGYTIKVSAVKKSFNLSLSPGSSQGSIKFVINKQ